MSVFLNRGKGTNCLLFIVEDVPDKSLKIRKPKAKVKSTQIFNIGMFVCKPYHSRSHSCTMICK